MASDEDEFGYSSVSHSESSALISLERRPLTPRDPFLTSLSISRNLREDKISDLEAFTHLLKGNLGSGMLGLPFAVSLAGLAIGPPLLLFISVLAIYSMCILVQTSHKLAEKHCVSNVNYGDVVQLAFQDYFNNDGHLGRHLVNGFLIVTQFGFCAIYFIFISQNIKVVLDNYYEDLADLPLKVYIVVLVVPIMCLTFIWSIKALAIISLVGNFFIFSGIILIVVVLIKHTSLDNVDQILIGNIKDMPLFFGMAIYAFEGIGLVLPLENQMRQPRNFYKVLISGMTFVVILQTTFASLGYLCYRENVLGSISFNLPGTVLGSMAQLCVAFAQFLTYALQFYIPVEILMPALSRRLLAYSPFSIEFWFRVIMVVMTCSLALIIPHIELFIALIGALASSSLALIFPPLVHMMVFRNSTLRLALHWFIILVGTGGAVIGTIYAVKDIISTIFLSS